MTLRRPLTVSAALPTSHVTLRGEEEEQYSQILDQVTHSISPTNIFEEIWIRDITDNQWEVLRLRRLKDNLLQIGIREGLIKVLGPLTGIGENDYLADGWYSGDKQAKQKVDKLLNDAGLSFDVVLAEGLAAKLDDIERFDQRIVSAESRRNAALRELNRHRDTVAARLHRASAGIEEAEFAEIGLPDGEKVLPNGQRS